MSTPNEQTSDFKIFCVHTSDTSTPRWMVVRAVKETATTFTLFHGGKVNKRSVRSAYFSTWDQTLAYLQACTQEKIDTLERQLADQKQFLERLQSMVGCDPIHDSISSKEV